MADNNTKTYNIVINGLKESINAVDSLNKQLDALDKRINELSKKTINVDVKASAPTSAGGKSTNEEAVQKEINKLKQEEDRLNAKIAASQDEIYKKVDATKQKLKDAVADQKAMAADARLLKDAYANTMQGMKDKLADLKASINATDLGDSDKIKKMTQEANELTQKLKEMEESYGTFGRNVGNYQSALQGLDKLKIEVGGVVREFSSAREASRTLKNELTQLEITEKGNTKQADELRSAYYKLQSAMDDATKSSKAMDEAMDMMQSFTAMASVGNGLKAFFGLDDNEITRSIQKLVALQGVLQGLENIRKQMETREGIGKILGKGFKDIDKWTYGLQRANVALRGTGTAAHAAALGIKALNIAMKALMSAGILVGIGLLVEGLQKIVVAAKDWVKGDADLVNATDVVNSAIEQQNKILEKNLTLIQEATNKGYITAEQARVLTEKEYARALEETNKRLQERAELIATQGINRKNVSNATGKTNLDIVVGDKGVTTVGGFSEGIKSIEDFKKRWDELEKAVANGKGMKSLLSTASDARDEFNHLNKLVGRDFINAISKFSDGTAEGARKLANYVDEMDKLTDGRYSRAIKLIKVDNEGLQAELDNAWAQIETLRDKILSNPIVVRMELNAKIEGELDKLDPTRVMQRNVDQWTQMLVLGVDEAGNKLTDAQRKNIQKIVDEGNKNIAKQRKQRLDSERNAGRKLSQEAERVEKEINQLRIENMEEGLDKEIAKLKEERREKLRQAEITGIRVGELTLEINKLYDKKEEDARKEHAANVKKIYDDMWEDILRSYNENVRMNFDSELTALETKLKKAEEQATELLNPRYASYGGTQLDNRINDKLRRGLGYDVLVNKPGEKSKYNIEDAKKYLDLLEAIENIELQLENNEIDVFGFNEEQLKEELEKAKAELAEFDESIKESVEYQQLVQVGYTKSISTALNLRLAEAKKYYNTIEELEAKYAKSAMENDKALLLNEKNTAEIDEIKRYEEQLAKLDDARKKGLLTEERYNNLSEEAQTQHEEAMKQIQIRFTTESERIQQDYVDNLKEITSNGMRGMLNEYRDAFDNISKIQSRQPQLSKGVLGDMGIINFGLSKKKYEEALEGYQNLSRKILDQKAELQQKLDNKEISFDDFQQAKRELDGLAQDCADAATDVQSSLKNLTSDFLGSINQNLQLALQGISDVISVIFEAQNAQFEEEQEEINKSNEMLEKALDKQQKIVEEHKNAIESIEDELATSRGDRRQHLIDQLNAEIEAQRAAAAEEKRLQKQKEANEEKQERLDKKKKMAQYKNDIASIIVSGAMAAANGFATKPFLPTGLAMGALATTLTAAQLAIAMSHKPYANGGQLDGGVAVGNRHRDGGIKVLGGRAEIEGGEFITNRISTQMNAPLLEFINSKKKRIDVSDLLEFYSSGSVKKNISSVRTRFADGGYIPTLPDSLDVRDQLQNVIINQDNRPIYCSVVDINNKQADVRRVQILAGLGE